MVAHTVAAAKAALAKKAKPRKGSYTVTKPTGAALRLVKPYLVDRAVRWAQKQDNICDLFESALTAVFGTRPVNGWRDSDGYDCQGFDTDERDRDGYDRRGYDENGMDEYGNPRHRSVAVLVEGWLPPFKDEVLQILLRDQGDQENQEQVRARATTAASTGWPNW